MKISNIDVTYVGHCGTDLTTVNAARVSFGKEVDFVKAKDVQLIRYLAKHKHFSPFNHSFISVRVKAPIFVARQLVKHRFMPWNEISRRYVDEEPEFYVPDVWRERADNIKQGSSAEVAVVDRSDILASIQDSVDHYKFLLEESKVAPEQARMVLPQSVMTEWLWSGTLGAFCDMLRLRLDPHTQYESRIVANRILEIVSPLFPVSVAALLGTNEAV